MSSPFLLTSYFTHYVFSQSRRSRRSSSGAEDSLDGIFDDVAHEEIQEVDGLVEDIAEEIRDLTNIKVSQLLAEVVFGSDGRVCNFVRIRNSFGFIYLDFFGNTLFSKV